MNKLSSIVIILAVIILSLSAVFYFSADKRGRGADKSAADIFSFADCVAAGYPVMESYPRQCRTQDGRIFVEQNTFESPTDDNEMVCTIEAKQCPDGSWVSRIPPNCDFAPCPNEPTL